MNLSATETRVLGCLLEKQRTTPDMYPLTLNGLRLACNQSTNRDPVVEYDDAIIRDALHRLERRGFARLASGRSSRAPKYRHLLADALPMAADEQAVVCVLMLRGPQTPGELKQRTERMHAFAELASVHETLARLIERELVACLGRRPGQKEDRYTQLLEDRETDEAPIARPATPSEASSWTARATPARDDLEERVARLEREVAVLRAAAVEATVEAAGARREEPDGEAAGGEAPDAPAHAPAPRALDPTPAERRADPIPDALAHETPPRAWR